MACELVVTHDPEKWARGSAPAINQADKDEWRLTTSEKKRILLDNIFGVDIDLQAVEVTKLSLLLKVLEGASGQMTLGLERVLPDLDKNIQCGNSLIGPDYFEGNMFPDEEERYRVNPFNWQAAYPKIFIAGGFDAVIGNPPYIFTRNQGIDEAQKKYFYSHYHHQSSQFNTFGIFLEQSYHLMKKSSYLGFITPNNWLTIDTFSALRKFLIESTRDIHITNILDRVFTANVDTAITIFQKGVPTILHVAELQERKESFRRVVELSTIKPPAYIIQISLLKNTGDAKILASIENNSLLLSHFSTVSTGLKVYQTGKGKPPQSDYQKHNRVFHATSKINGTYEKYLDGVDVCRYKLGWSGEYLSYGDWIAEPRRSVPFWGTRLLIRQIPSKPPYLVHAVMTEDKFYNDINSMVIFNPVESIDLKYLLGLINSRLLSYWFQKTFDKLQRKIFPQFKVKELASFPIKPINVSDSVEKAAHDRMVSLVERMLALHKRSARTPQEKEMLQREIESTDGAIDSLVYQLYSLTEAEIKIVEGG